MKIFIGIIIGILLTQLNKYLKRNHINLRWKNIILFLMIIHFIYSCIGIIASPGYTKANGNVCRGFNYGIHMCSGDINAE